MRIPIIAIPQFMAATSTNVTSPAAPGNSSGSSQVRPGAPSPALAPAGAQAPAGVQAPAGAQAPAVAQAPAGAQAPARPQASAVAQAQAGAQAPARPQAPSGAPSPARAQAPAVAQAPAAAQTTPKSAVATNNSNGKITLVIDDAPVSGIRPNITLLVTRVNNATQISIKSGTP